MSTVNKICCSTSNSDRLDRRGRLTTCSQSVLVTSVCAACLARLLCEMTVCLHLARWSHLRSHRSQMPPHSGYHRGYQPVSDRCLEQRRLQVTNLRAWSGGRCSSSSRSQPLLLNRRRQRYPTSRSYLCQRQHTHQEERRWSWFRCRPKVRTSALSQVDPVSDVRLFRIVMLSSPLVVSPQLPTRVRLWLRSQQSRAVLPSRCALYSRLTRIQTADSTSYRTLSFSPKVPRSRTFLRQTAFSSGPLKHRRARLHATRSPRFMPTGFRQ